MNSFSVNASSINGSNSRFYNANLVGGLSSVSVIYSLFLASAVLTTPLNSSAGLGGNYTISPSLHEGCYSSSVVESLSRVDAKLSGDLKSLSYLDSNLLFKVTGGVQNSTFVDGGYLISPPLKSGVFSSTFINDNSYTYPFMDGLYCSSNLQSTLNIGILGGINSNSKVEGLWGVRNVGGLYGNTNVDGIITTSLRGGVISSAYLNAYLYLPVTLPGGISRSFTTLEGSIVFNSGMFGGIYSYPDTTSLYLIDSVLHNGVFSNHLVGGNILASALVKDGINSNYSLSANGIIDISLKGGLPSSVTTSGELKSNFSLNYGLASNTLVDMKYFSTGRFTGGLISYLTLGGECDCSVLLQSGIQMSATMGGGMQGSAIIGGGIFRAGHHFNSGIRLSPVLISEKTNSSYIQSNYIIDALLVDGLNSYSIVEANDLLASINLQGEISSNAVFYSNIIINPSLLGGIESTCNVVSNLIIDGSLSGGFDIPYSLLGDLDCSPMLQGSLFNETIVNSTQKVDNVLGDTYGIASGVYFGGQIKIEPVIIGGIYSPSMYVNDNDISSYIGDMLHNTSQLGIASATQILKIEVPIGDT